MTDMYYAGKPGDTPVKMQYVVNYLRVIASGWKVVPNTSDPYPTMPAGELNQSPLGLGLLLAGGYMADAGLFYCPSSDGMPSAHTNKGERYAYSLSQWRTAGGMSPGTLLYGNWQPCAYTNQDGGAGTRNVRNITYSHYAYRNIPWWMDSCGHFAADGKELMGTNPRVKVNQTVPMLRTQRILGARAIVMDPFDKGYSYDALGRSNAPYDGGGIEEGRAMAGMGIKGHINGYNVLYGDGHVAWFGDP